MRTPDVEAACAADAETQCSGDGTRLRSGGTHAHWRSAVALLAALALVVLLAAPSAAPRVAGTWTAHWGKQTSSGKERPVSFLPTLVQCDSSRRCYGRCEGERQRADGSRCANGWCHGTCLPGWYPGYAG